MRVKKKSKEKNIKFNIKERLWGLVTSSQGLPVVLALTTLAILFVLFRMKAVEQNYTLISLNKEIENHEQVGKELKARKARMLSVKNLKDIANRHNLREPTSEQLIIIPGS